MLYPPDSKGLETLQGIWDADFGATVGRRWNPSGVSSLSKLSFPVYLQVPVRFY